MDTNNSTKTYNVKKLDQTAASMSPASRAAKLSALRSFYRWCTRWEHRTDDPTRMNESTIRTIAAMPEQPTCTTLPDGSKQWWLDGEPHRTDGPAVEWADGSKTWYLHDKRHRTDGPAVERADGTKMWYLNGKHLTEAEHAKRTA